MSAPDLPTGGRRKRRNVEVPRRDGAYGLVEQYIGERHVRGEFAPATITVTRQALCSYVAFVDGDLAAMSERSVLEWLGKSTLTPNSVKSYLTKLRGFARWLVRNGHLASNVCDEIPTPKGVHGMPRCLPVDAVADVYDACPDARARLVITLMVQLGLRCAEVAAIQMIDVDLDRRMLVVRGKGHGGDRSHAIPITDPALAALRAYLDDDTPARGPLERRWQPRYHGAERLTGPLVRSYQPPYGHLTPHWVSRIVRQWMSASGIKNYARDGVSAHAFRHTAAQDVLDRGADVRHVQAMLGHRSLTTTQEYLRLNPPGLRDALEGRDYRRA